MTDRIFDVNVNFLENCNYNASTTNKEINLPLQTPTVTVQPILNGSPCYGDTIEFEALVQYDNHVVQSGVVSFYYVSVNDVQGTEYLINNVPVDVDIQGNARISFVPYGDCTIIAEYNGDPYLGIARGEYAISLNKIPTEITFIDTPPYFVDPQNDIELNVQVRDARNNNFLDYGIVTFMHYDTFFDHPTSGEEKVIGNPVYLIDGEGHIKYSPVQNKSRETESNLNVEMIRACYNYDNNLYGVNWKYYLQDCTWTSIALLKENILNIAIVKLENDEYYPLDLEHGMFCATNNDDIYIMFNIPGYTFHQEDKIKICIEGRDDVIYAEYNEELNVFKRRLINLAQGTYGIYGVAIDEDGSYLHSYGNIITNVDDINISDNIYLQSTESQHLYLKIEEEERDYTLDFANDENYILLNNKQPLTLRLNITSTDGNEITLVGQQCYFRCSTLEQTYIRTIQKDNNNNVYVDLDIITEKTENGITTLVENIPLRSVNDYIFYAYIEQNGKKTSSDTIIVRVRENPSLELNIHRTNSTYPGQIKYTLVGNNIYKEQLSIDLFDGNTKVNTTELLIDCLCIQQLDT